MLMKTEVLRRMWQSVESSNPSTLLKMSDEEIVRNIIRQLNAIFPLASKDTKILNDYISARTPLIRDLLNYKLTTS